MMTAGEICTRAPAIATRNDTLIQAAQQMRASHVGALVVVENRHDRRVPIGILTDRDIVVGAVATNAGHVDSLRVGDVMGQDVVTVRESESLERALERMKEHGIRRLPVVSGDGALVGVLTLDDVLEVLTEQQVGLVKIVAQEQRHERHVRSGAAGPSRA
jgi:CBS domain-containing protein